MNGKHGRGALTAISAALASGVAGVSLLAASSAGAAIIEEHGSMQMKASIVDLASSSNRVETPPGPGGSPFCEGDGASGSRIQAVYGHVAGTPDNYAAELPTIRTMAAAIDDAFDMSAGRQGGSAHPRWATEPGTCELSVLKIELPADAPDNLNTTVATLDGLGLLTRTDRKYLVWVDATGSANLISQVRFDANPDPATNLADGGQQTALVAQLARNGGWDTDGFGGPFLRWGPQHEVAHLLGAVNPAAPNSDGSGHCTEEFDAMCVAPPGGEACPAFVPDKLLLDCNGNDYFAVNPAPGSYLDTNWNTYDSSFLVRTDTPDLPPETTLDAGPTGTATVATAEFTFSSNEGGTFECSLDGADFAACSSPRSYTGLTNGPHTFRVRAVDAAGNRDFTPAERTWTVAVEDAVAPLETTITEKTVNSKRRKARFKFTAANVSGALSFQCKVDRRKFKPCSSPKTLRRLKPGRHVFKVRAVDDRGPDPTPARKRFRIQRR